MRRYLPLLLLSFFVVVLITSGTTFLAGYAGKETPENHKTVVVYTTLPLEQVTVLTQEYEKSFGVRVTLVPLTPADLLIKARFDAGTPQAADLLLTSQAALQAAKKGKMLAPYTSEAVDLIPERFCDDDGFWVGVWYDPIVFAANKDFLKDQPRPPSQWADLAKPGNFRLVVTDFLAADASANLLYSLAGVNGEKDALAYLAKIHPKIVQYSKFLVTPPRMAGLGEADIAIAVQSESMRYVKDGFPLQIIYPEDGTAYLLTGVGLVADAPHADEAKRFINWLIQDPVPEILQRNRFYLVPTNPETKIYKESNAKAISLFEYEDKLTLDQKAKLLDKWVQTVRLSPR
ncbi:MAG: extracellular solute-binding protein [Negativicutes bacterium]|nr:extracellular solute-binding protein [Negativicutes bacterium]